MPRVTAIHVHPVKSCHRVEVDDAVVGEHGLVGDREWQLIDPGGGFLTQRAHPVLARVHAETTATGVVLRCDGQADLAVDRPPKVDRAAHTYTGEVPVADAGDAAAAWFERLISAPCRLVAMTNGYERRFQIPAAAFPDPSSGFAAAVERASAPELSFADGAQVLVINAASHRDLADRAVEPFGMERWRANVIVDGAEPWAEDTWRRIRIGDATLDVGLPWPRCAVPQVDQETGDRHREPALVLKARRWCTRAGELPELLRPVLEGNALFGVTAAATPAGVRIAVGDDVEVLETGPAVLSAVLD
ncbi:MAG: uncharacterized protein QOD30_2304 [Actinomycetota bacterium]|nr:uncharacterized protein [Actinomycetota bacterium]